jgi:hypothetical protein
MTSKPIKTSQSETDSGETDGKTGRETDPVDFLI